MTILLVYLITENERNSKKACASYSVVAYYLSANGRHVEFNIFKLAKIEILF